MQLLGSRESGSSGDAEFGGGESRGARGTGGGGGTGAAPKSGGAPKKPNPDDFDDDIPF